VYYGTIVQIEVAAMKGNSLKRRVLFVAFLLGLFVYDSVGGQLPPGVVASFGDSYFDLRIFYENEQLLRNEADTNRDHRVDVWAFYKDGKLVRQDEDLNFNGRISARYYFKDGNVIKEEKVADEEPWAPSELFSSVQEELNRMISEVPGIKRAEELLSKKAMKGKG
jgi:hypothetical protein